MDRTVEERFIRQYIKEDRQERLLFELFSKKNRKKALSRFAHGAELLLKPGYRKCAAIDLSFLKQVKTAYVIPSDGDLDGAEAPGETVFSLCQNETSPVIVIGEGFAIVREELEAGAPAIFLLR
ncbi:MAG: hypothetical protein IKP74_06515 [Clostridia bacterium]|nr:hypothetical protein [Clostridia bacterium]